MATSELTATINEVLQVLTDKERDVIRGRFALSGGQRETLEAIGKKFNVTRERIRQIEAAALKKLRRTVAASDLAKISNIGKKEIEKAGGVLLEEMMISRVLEKIQSVSQIDGCIIKLSLSVHEDVMLQERTRQFKPFWHLRTIAVKDIAVTANRAAVKLEKATDVVDEETLVNQLRAMAANSSSTCTHPAAIASVLHADHRFKHTEKGWGLMTWRHIHPRSIRDKALMVMRSSEKPMHFVEIANAIAEGNFNKKTVTIQAVHNELIRDSRFALVGRGLYALAEWGYSSGSITDIIEDYLTKKGASDRDDIVNAVLQERQVRRSTVVLNLQKTEWFVRVGRRVYEFDPKKKKLPKGKRTRRG